MTKKDYLKKIQIKYQSYSFIEPTAFFFNFYLFGANTLLNELIKHMLEKQRFTDPNSYNDYTYIQSNNTIKCVGSRSIQADNDILTETSFVVMYADIVAIVPAFFVAILLGGYSDSHGRLDVIMFCLTGASIRIIINLVMAIWNFSVYFLILSSFIDSFFGMSSTFYMGTYAYLSDITTNKDRSYRMVRMEVFAGLGIIISNIAVGYFISSLGFVWSLIIILFALFINLLYVCFLKESLDITDSSNKPLISLKYFSETYKLYTSKLNRTSDLLFTLALIFLISFVQLGCMNVIVLYLISSPLCLDPTNIGFFLSLVTLCNIISSSMVTKLFEKYLGDTGLVLVGSVFGMIFFILLAASTSKTLLFIVPFAGCLMTLPLPILKSMASKIVRPDQLGMLFGSLVWAQMMGILVGIMVQTAIYASTLQSHSYTVFVVNVFVYALAMLLLIVYILKKKRESRMDEEDNYVMD